MFKIAIALFGLIACVLAKPGIVAPIAYTAPLVAAPGVVTATSSQYVARNHNGIVAPIIAAAPAKLVAPSLAYTAYTAPHAHVAAAPAKLVAPGHVAYTSPYTAAYTSPYVHSHYAAPFAYTAPYVL